ncbi:MAG: 6-bladed beta-propeller [Bacteroidetes bacterium]|nr:6-bladed beta-propeller [Bacteroidota bacterium]MCY4232951.1 6-bladed beta-propeller [Bacteroidota bacterium]
MLPSRIINVFLGATFFALTLSSCSNEELNQLNEIPLKAVDVLESIDGDIFLEQVYVIQQYGDILYLSDKGYQLIFALDNDFRVIRTIGQQGRGPGEFSEGPFTFRVVNDEIYGYNTASRSIQVFSLLGDFQRSIPLDPKDFIWHDGLALDPQGYLYIAPDRTQNPYFIIKVDSLGNIMNKFGQLLQTSYSEVQNRRQSSRTHISVTDKYLIAMGDYVPVIERYTLDGELLQSVDLTDSPYFSERYKFAQEEYAKGITGNYSLVSITKVFNSRLYVIPIEGPQGYGMRVSRILEFDIETLDLLNTYALLDLNGDPLRWVNVFEFISENELIVFHESEGVFYLYSWS